jgi:Fe-S cluster biogenesis protein NfuA
MSIFAKFFARGRHIDPDKIDRWQRIEVSLERVRPMLQADGGDIELVDITENSIKVRMTGACSHCPSSAYTLAQGVERVLREDIPEFKELIVL